FFNLFPVANGREIKKLELGGESNRPVEGVGREAVESSERLTVGLGARTSSKRGCLKVELREIGPFQLLLTRLYNVNRSGLKVGQRMRRDRAGRRLDRRLPLQERAFFDGDRGSGNSQQLSQGRAAHLLALLGLNELRFRRRQLGLGTRS